MKVQKMTHLGLTEEELKAAIVQYLTDKSVITDNKELAGYLVSMATNGWDWDYGDEDTAVVIIIEGISEEQYHELEPSTRILCRDRISPTDGSSD